VEKFEVVVVKYEVHRRFIVVMYTHVNETRRGGVTAPTTIATHALSATLHDYYPTIAYSLIPSLSASSSLYYIAAFVHW